jgi:glycosyltransferase involved in cell wall biosynthesis
MGKSVFFVRDEPWNSFGRQASLLEQELARRGYYVKPQDKRTFLRALTPPGFDVYLYYTVFNSDMFNTGIMPYENNVVFEVADSDRVSEKAISFFLKNRVKTIVVPSQFSKNAFLSSTREKLPPIQVIRHALNPAMYKYPEIRVPHPCVIAICPHSWDRKGCNLVIRAVRELLNKDVYFFFIMTSDRPVDGLVWKKAPLQENEYYSLLKSCDVLLYPVRGGAFEIPVFEALALGLDVVLTEKGPWMEYVLSPDDVYPVKVNGMKRYWYTNLYHVGRFFEPDLNSVIEQLKNAIENWTPERKKERLNTIAPKYREYLSVEKVVDEWERVL